MNKSENKIHRQKNTTETKKEKSLFLVFKVTEHFELMKKKIQMLMHIKLLLPLCFILF